MEMLNVDIKTNCKKKKRKKSELCKNWTKWRTTIFICILVKWLELKINVSLFWLVEQQRIQHREKYAKREY